MNKIFFIIGANGVGKSTIIPYLKSILPENKFVIYDFDARGVPADADSKWRISETAYWISEGKKILKDKKSTVICGFIKPSDIEVNNLKNPKNPEIVLILLDAQADIIKQRLTKRYTKSGVFDKTQKVIGKAIDEFINGNLWFAEKIKNDFEKNNLPIINTSDLSPKKVAQEIAKIILAN